MASRLYLGNLDKRVTEEDVKGLFSEKELPLESVLLKTGYAFVDCQDQATLDAAIDKLAGLFNLSYFKCLILRNISD